MRPNPEKKRRHLHVFLQYAAVSRQNRIVRSVLQRRTLLWFKKTTLGNRVIFLCSCSGKIAGIFIGISCILSRCHAVRCTAGAAVWLAAAGISAAELAALAVSAAMFVTKDKVFHYRKT